MLQDAINRVGLFNFAAKAIVMRKILFFGLAIVAFILLSGCASSQKIAALKPEPDDAAPLLYDNAVSFINLPIKIKLKDKIIDLRVSSLPSIHGESNHDDRR